VSGENAKRWTQRQGVPSQHRSFGLPRPLQPPYRESFRFIAFNRWDFAEFILERPTPVIVRGSEVCKVYHYSNPFEMPVKNRLLAIEG